MRRVERIVEGRNLWRETPDKPIARSWRETFVKYSSQRRPGGPSCRNPAKPCINTMGSHDAFPQRRLGFQGLKRRCHQCGRRKRGAARKANSTNLHLLLHGSPPFVRGSKLHTACQPRTALFSKTAAHSGARTAPCGCRRARLACNRPQDSSPTRAKCRRSDPALRIGKLPRFQARLDVPAQRGVTHGVPPVDQPLL